MNSNQRMLQKAQSFQTCSKQELSVPLMDNPISKQLLDWTKTRVQQAHDPLTTFNTIDSNRLTKSNFEAYPDSPTAQRYLKAYHLFSGGFVCLNSYEKETVQSAEDCDYLQFAFYSYSLAEICESHLYSRFPPPKNTSNLIKQYLKIRPNDVLVQFLKLILTHRRHGREHEQLTEYDFQREWIIAGEKFIHKRQRFVKDSELDRDMLVYLYYILGVTYVISFQKRRSLDSFQKSYDLDPSNVAALYGVAYQYMENDPEKAIRIFREFISKAPECDKQYPNAYYMMAYLYFVHYKNESEAMRLCRLAEQAEEKRLEFLYPVDIPQKEIMQLWKSMKSHPKDI